MLPLASSDKAVVKASATTSNKRSRGTADREGQESLLEKSIVHARKRAKFIISLPSDDGTLVASARSKSTVISSSRESDPQKVSKTSSRVLSENAVARKKKTTSQRIHQARPKPSRAEVRKGLPQEVLNRIKARPLPSSPQSDTDPIDFLS